MNKPSPVEWNRVRAAAAEKVAALGDLALGEITPSRRDFTRFLGSGRREVAVIATVRRRDPWSGETWEDLDVVAAAAAMDEADVAGVAVTTEALFHGGRSDDLQRVASTVTAPVLRDEPLLHPLQVFESRALGADACVVPAAWVAPDVLAEMVRIASSLHMAALVSVFRVEEVPSVLPYDKHPVGVWAQDGGGDIDFARLAEIAAAIPARRPLVLLGDVREPERFRALRDRVDAALVARLFARAAPDDVVRALVDD